MRPNLPQCHILPLEFTKLPFLRWLKFPSKCLPRWMVRNLLYRSLSCLGSGKRFLGISYTIPTKRCGPIDEFLMGRKMTFGPLLHNRTYAVARLENPAFISQVFLLLVHFVCNSIRWWAFSNSRFNGCRRLDLSPIRRWIERMLLVSNGITRLVCILLVAMSRVESTTISHLGNKRGLNINTMTFSSHCETTW